MGQFRLKEDEKNPEKPRSFPEVRTHSSQYPETILFLTEIRKSQATQTPATTDNWDTGRLSDDVCGYYVDYGDGDTIECVCPKLQHSTYGFLYTLYFNKYG